MKYFHLAIPLVLIYQSPHLTQNGWAAHKCTQVFPLSEIWECHLKDFPLPFLASPQRRKDTAKDVTRHGI